MLHSVTWLSSGSIADVQAQFFQIDFESAKVDRPEVYRMDRP
jgi:hypothetical protein